MFGEKQISALIALFYDAAVDPERWPAALNLLADSLQAGSAALGLQHAVTHAHTAIAPRNDPDFQVSYAAYYGRINPLVRGLAGLPLGRAVVDDELIPKSALHRTEFYADWLRPQRMNSSLAAAVLADGTRIGFVNVIRNRGEDFGKADLRAFALIAPHLQRAVQLQLRLEEAAMTRASSAAMLDHLAEGAILVDAGARVLYANRPAERLLAAREGLLRRSHGLVTARAEATSALHRLIAEAASAGAGGSVLVARPQGRPLSVLVAPLRTEVSWLARDRPAAIVFVRDPDRLPEVSVRLLRTLFGLTPAQAILARELTRGGGARATAQRLGLSHATVRAHLLQIFAKTGTQRQAELIGLVLTCARSSPDGD